MNASAPVLIDRRDAVTVVTINRPDHRNAVDRTTAERLTEIFREFDDDDDAAVAVLTGTGGNFCAGADLKAVAKGEPNRIGLTGDGPMGPTRLSMSKPIIAAVEGYAVAGGLELAIWCDLRVASRSAVFGVFCRRFGVPLVDLGTIRLPRLIGQSRAMDLILTGRAVSAEEAWQMGLANRICDPGQALESAVELADTLARLPQRCMRNDRLSVLRQWDLTWDAATHEETRLGLDTLDSGETEAGAKRFAAGRGRHGDPAED